jgi:hypothetical protein
VWGGIQGVVPADTDTKIRICLSSFVIRNASVDCSSPYSDLLAVNVRMMNWKGIGWKRLWFVSLCCVTLLRFWPVEELAKLVALLDMEKWRGLGVLICFEMQCNKVSCND